VTEPDPQQQDSSNPLEDAEEQEGHDLHEASTGDQGALEAMPGGDGDPEDAVTQRQPATATRDQDDTDRNR
jgi:hypothetical protein